MFLFKTSCFRIFTHFERYVSSFVPTYRTYKYGSNFMLPKQTFISRYFANYNKKLHDDVSRGDIEVSQTFVCFKYLRLIKNAVREAGPNVEDNLKLTHIVNNAQSNNLSSDFIEFAIKISCNTRAKIGLYDVILPNGCHFVIQYEDIDTTTTKHHLLGLCETYDGSLIQGNTKWPQNFNQKGIVMVNCNDSDSFSDESQETVLSNSGAELLHKEIDAEGIEYWKFYCEPWQLHHVKKKVSEITNNIEEAFVGYVPKRKVTPSQHVKNSACNIFIELGKVSTIDNVYHNINIFE